MYGLVWKVSVQGLMVICASDLLSNQAKVKKSNIGHDRLISMIMLYQSKILWWLLLKFVLYIDFWEMQSWPPINIPIKKVLERIQKDM
jgi:hypothetical protein